MPVPRFSRIAWIALIGGAVAGFSVRGSQCVAAEPAACGSAVTVEEVQFRHGDDLLAGNLYCPVRVGRRPAIALVLGSGAQDRRYGGIGTALGYHFAESGVTCLVWDKPGVGKSTRDFNAQTFQDRAEETLAGLQFLRSRADVRANAVGLWGHSQGGMVVPLAASRSADVAFLIQVAGWQGPVWRQDAARVEAELRAAGFSAAEIKDAVRFAHLRMDLIRGTGPFEALESAQADVKSRPWFASVHWCDHRLFHAARLTADYDTGPSWEKVRCPALVIYGDRDTSSGPPEPLVAIIRRGLEKAKNSDVTVRVFPKADHSLCVTEAGRPDEQANRANARRGQGEVNFVPGYLDLMTDWINERFPSDH